MLLCRTRPPSEDRGSRRATPRFSAGRIPEAVRTCGTRTAEWLARADWRAAAGVTSVAMEATGVFGKPVFNLWEGRFAVLLVTPQHIQPVRGARPTSQTARGSPHGCRTACCAAVASRHGPFARDAT